MLKQNYKNKLWHFRTDRLRQDRIEGLLFSIHYSNVCIRQHKLALIHHQGSCTWCCESASTSIFHFSSISSSLPWCLPDADLLPRVANRSRAQYDSRLLYMFTCRLCWWFSAVIAIIFRPRIFILTDIAFLFWLGLHWVSCLQTTGHRCTFKGALYRIWCGVNRLGDSGVKVVRPECIPSAQYLNSIQCPFKTGYMEFAWKEYYADAIHSAIVNAAGNNNWPAGLTIAEWLTSSSHREVYMPNFKLLVSEHMSILFMEYRQLSWESLDDKIESHVARTHTHMREHTHKYTHTHDTATGIRPIICPRDTLPRMSTFRLSHRQCTRIDIKFVICLLA